MKQLSLVSMVCIAAASAAMVAGCNPVTEFRNIVDGGSEALSQEGAAYRQLTATAPSRGEAAIGALSAWVGKLNNLAATMAEASKKLQGKKEAKIRANKDVQTALSRFKSGVDEVLGRNYGEAALKLVPPWRLREAQDVAAQVPTALSKVGSYYEAVFATKSPYAGKTYGVDVIEDQAVLDTYASCVDKVAQVSRSQAKSNYCVSAAQIACGHQINVGCVEGKVRAALSNNLCPEVKTVVLKINADQVFRPEGSISANEELKEWKYGAYVSEPNPDRSFGTFCQGNYDAAAKVVTSSTICGFGPKVRIYGYDPETRHVLVEIEGVKNQDDPRKDVIVDIYAEGSFVGTRVVRADYGWRNNVYAFEITERAFQENSRVKLQFRDLVNVNINSDPSLPKQKRAHWVVDAVITGPDLPFLKKREVLLTKYTPNTWVAGIVNACVSPEPILK